MHTAAGAAKIARVANAAMLVPSHTTAIKEGNMRAFIFVLALVLAPSAFAWDGSDQQTGSDIEIESGGNPPEK